MRHHARESGSETDPDLQIAHFQLAYVDILGMEFFFAIVFLLVYYIRPQDWVPGMAGAEIIRPIVALWLFSIVLARSRNSPLIGFLRTPHDVIICAYLAYIVFFGGAPVMETVPMLAFYALTVQSLNTWPRLLKYLKIWTLALFLISLLGVLSFYGFDPTGAQANAFTQMGRLAIGTWLHDNPNALGHSIVVVIPASFVLYFWKENMAKRFLIFPLFSFIAFYCAWQTQSKGAYLVGASALIIAMILGKPKWLQAIVLSATLIVGVSALSFLPRMSDMNNLRADEGVQGRLLAWEMAKTAEEQDHTGIGWRQFIAYIPWKEGNKTLIVPKGTHSSYIQVAADLGRYGLFFYLAGIWCAFHTLLFFKTTDPDQERCRRVLLVFLIANLISGWMINRSYHTEYFLLIAASAAMHRLKKSEELPVTAPEPAPIPASATPAPMTASALSALTKLPASVRAAWERKERPAFSLEKGSSSQLGRPFWNRFGIFDFGLSMVMTWLTFATWDYVLKNL
jgi:hypothetical protein